MFTSETIVHCLVLLVALIAILGASELFTNGIEWLGLKLKLSEGVVGSVLAATGTALPETLIPIVAVLVFRNEEARQVGIGAIAGAPFMLSTLTLSLLGMAVLIFSRMGLRTEKLTINKVVISRDLRFFMASYSISLLSGVLSLPNIVRCLIGVGLLAIYGLYLYQTLKSEGEAGEAPEGLHFNKLFKMDTGMLIIAMQVLIGLAGITGGAYVFVEHVQAVAHAAQMPELILALLIAPIATELPEKINSILWARNRKDTLALGNITGALVFQSSFPVAFGVAFTNWQLGSGVLVTGLIALGSAFVLTQLIQKEKLRPQYLVIGAVFYFAVTSWLIVSGQVS